MSARFAGTLWANRVWNAHARDAYALKDQQVQGAPGAFLYALLHAGPVPSADVRRAGLPPSLQASGGMVLVFRIISDT